MAETNNNVSVGVDLSENELWYVLYQFPTRAIPSASVPDLPNEQLAMLLQAAEQSLRGRGLLEISEDGTRKLSKTLVALIGSGVLAKKVLYLSYQNNTTTTDTTWFYFSPEINVAHNYSTGGIHRFFIINSGDLLISSLILGLHLDTSVGSVTSDTFTIPQTFLTTMRAEPNSALEKLSQVVKFNANDLSSFTKTVLEVDAFCQVILMNNSESAPESFNLLYNDQEGYWMLQSNNDDLICSRTHPLQITGLITSAVS
jgi:hypothetical protein